MTTGEIAIDIVGGGSGGGGAGMAGVMLASGLAQTTGQQASALTVRLAPAANAAVQTWSLAGNQIIAAGDQLSQAAQNASQAGNTTDPGGHGQLNDPGQDPWLGRELTEQEVQQFSKESTHLGTNKVTVLGHFKPSSGPNYIEAAKAQGASYFDMPANLSQSLTSAHQWELNKQFLRDAVVRGDKIIVGTKIDYQNVGSWLFREINFLKEEFHLVLQDGVFVPGP